MVVTKNIENNSLYSINNISENELMEIKELIDEAKLPLKRSFYNVQKTIETIIKQNSQPKKIAHGADKKV